MCAWKRNKYIFNFSLSNFARNFESRRQRKRTLTELPTKTFHLFIINIFIKRKKNKYKYKKKLNVFLYTYPKKYIKSKKERFGFISKSAWLLFFFLKSILCLIFFLWEGAFIFFLLLLLLPLLFPGALGFYQFEIFLKKKK